ncbi:MAG: glycosyltransferase family 4 protein [Xanthomonadales bacterium]|nr:glycosyltransferase family 4 protein [Xanthomonadales bacterium]
MAADLAPSLTPDALRRATPQRVLMTADTVGGVWTYALELCRGLAAQGTEVVLASLGRLPDASQRRAAAAIPGLELHPSSWRLIWMDEPWADLEAAGEWLMRLAEETRPDIVHLNDLGQGALPWRAPVLTVAHSCVLSWWHAVHGCPAPAGWSRYAAEVRRSIAASDLLVAPSHALLANIRQHYGPLPPARVIANGSSAPARVARTRKAMILAAGRIWDEAKNLGALAAIAPRLSWPVWVAGPTESPDGHPVNLRNVTLPGMLAPAELGRHRARAAIYALPARYEPFGLSILEAAQAGCALVLGDIPSLRENWDGAALFVPPDDHDALQHALQGLIDDEMQRTRLAAAARRRAARFTAAAMVDAYLQAYAGLAPARASERGQPMEVLP